MAADRFSSEQEDGCVFKENSSWKELDWEALAGQWTCRPTPAVTVLPERSFSYAAVDMKN